MAVTVISAPSASPVIISASYPVVFVLESDQFGGAGITQFRYAIEIINNVAGSLGYKYSVPHGGVYLSRGTLDISNTMRTEITLSEKAHPGSPDITQITEPRVLYNQYSSVSGFTINIYEEYYDNGVRTVNAGPSYTLIAGRGWTDDIDDTWLYHSWNQVNGLDSFMPYSGMSRIVYPQRLEDAAWPTPFTHRYMNIQMFELGGGLDADWWIDREAFELYKIVYFPLYVAGVSDQPGFLGEEIKIWTSATNGSGGVLQEQYNILTNVKVDCDEQEMVIMFRDRLFAWAFMSFPMKSRTTVNARSEQAEITSGRFRYNVDSSNTLTLNTNWMQEEQNPLMQDLMATEESYLVESDGALTPVTIQSNSMRLRTRRNDGLVQYTINVRMALDNFKA